MQVIGTTPSNSNPLHTFFRDVAALMKKHIPDTYGCEDVLQTDEFGPLPMEKSKGEGGRSDLATNIGDNFYNQYVR